MKKIFVTKKIPDIGISMLREQGYDVTVSHLDKTLSKRELVEEIKKKKYDGLITLLNNKIDKQVLEYCALSGIKVIANYAVGLNNIDSAEAERLGIKVLNAKGTSAQAVAQHVVALALAVADRVIEGDYLVRKQKWRGWDPNLLMGIDICGKTLGLVGTGNIGQKVGEIFAKGFGCKIIYSDLNQNKFLEENFGATKKSLDEVLRNSDIVSLHVPLTAETTHLINSEKLNLLKSNCILINTARGPVVDEKALIKCLRQKKIFGAGLDVFEYEPKVEKSLRKLPNVVLTPHIASAKMSARIEMAVATAKNISDVLK